MSYSGFVRVKKKFAIDIFYWFIDNGIAAGFPLSLCPSMAEIFVFDVTPEQRILCIDYLKSVYGVAPRFYLS